MAKSKTALPVQEVTAVALAGAITTIGIHTWKWIRHNNFGF